MPRPIPIPDLIAVTERALGFNRGQLLVKTHRRKIAHARQEVFRIARKEGWSLHEIADVFGMDHSAILHGSRQAEARRIAALEAMP